MNLEYECPNCGKALFGEFGCPVICRDCKQGFDTDWEYVSEDSIGCWVVEDGYPIEEDILKK